MNNFLDLQMKPLPMYTTMIINMFSFNKVGNPSILKIIDMIVKKQKRKGHHAFHAIPCFVKRTCSNWVIAAWNLFQSVQKRAQKIERER